MNLKVKEESWYKNPEMVGHRWAQQFVELVEQYYQKNCKTKEQKQLFNQIIDLDNVEWSYWSGGITKKQLRILQYVLRRMGKISWNDLLNYVNWTQGCLKDKLTWFVEVKSYEEDPERYYRNYRVTFVSLGMSEADCKERFERYHQKLKEQLKLSETI